MYVCVCVFTQTTILELKKLVYLYMIAYAETDPETVVMSVNSFVKDASTLRSHNDGLTCVYVVLL